MRKPKQKTGRLPPLNIRRRLPLALAVLGILCLPACAAGICEGEDRGGGTFEGVCPAFPMAGALVAAELESLDEARYPALWEWLSRLEKLQFQLELCD